MTDTPHGLFLQALLTLKSSASGSTSEGKKVGTPTVHKKSVSVSANVYTSCSFKRHKRIYFLLSMTEKYSR